MDRNLLIFLLAAAIIILIASLWPGKKASDEETLNSQDWRVQDFRQDDETDAMDGERKK